MRDEIRTNFQKKKNDDALTNLFWNKVLRSAPKILRSAPKKKLTEKDSFESIRYESFQRIRDANNCGDYLRVNWMQDHVN